MIRASIYSVALAATMILTAPAFGQTTVRVSVSSSGTQGNGISENGSIDASGRFVAFDSDASNLVLSDTNGKYDVFVRDLQTGVTERVSVSSSLTEANNASRYPRLSADGRFVAFESLGSNLVGGDTNSANDVFVRDRQLGLTERVSVGAGGVQANGASQRCAISPDGRFVAFSSHAENLVAGDTNGRWDICVRDRQSATTERISVATGGSQAGMDSFFPELSADGRFVVFESSATNLVPGDTNGMLDVFLRDRQLGTTDRVSVATGGAEGNAGSEYATVSVNPLRVAFESSASNLVSGDTTGHVDIFVRDPVGDTTTRVSVGAAGGQSNGESNRPRISADGRYVAFSSSATNVVGGDTNGSTDCFVRDLQMGVTERVSIDSSRVQGNNNSYMPVFSGDGHYVIFHSSSTNLVGGDSNAKNDVFVHRRADTFVVFCEPGVNGVITCPCSNPPTGPERGCNNFAAGGTGGAMLIGAGEPVTSPNDTLTFSFTAGIGSSVTVLFQGTINTSNSRSGAGIRCISGTLKRIYKGNQALGAIMFPNNGVDVHVQSMTRGYTIVAPITLYYYCAYRNSAANGQPGCPGLTFGFNTTNAGAVSWYP